jgi:phosphatidylglycerol:prolipoprotein diacylglycerol transferase
MKPIPVVFHIGPLQIHTYGIGLAVTFWFALVYFERRLRSKGYSTAWVAGVFVWIIVAAVVGARVMHVLANISYYAAQPIQVLEVWHGGLSSFGGLLGAIPTGLWLVHKRVPEISLAKAMDLVAPVLIASWALGRLLGPQLMIAGGGHRTNQWFGMYYADQVGKRLPVPIFQSIETWIMFAILIAVERKMTNRPTGLLTALAAGLWGLGRFFDESLWLWKTGPGHLGERLVVAAAATLFVLGMGTVIFLYVRSRPNRVEGMLGTSPSGDGEAGGFMENGVRGELVKEEVRQAVTSLGQAEPDLSPGQS